MSLSISNIAWPEADDGHILALLKERNISLEVAPTRLWNEWEGCTLEAAKEFKKSCIVPVTSLQALLYQKPDLHLFLNGEKGRAKLFSHFQFVVDLAATLSPKNHCPALVFGSPKARKLSGLSYEEGEKIAVEFFRQVGAYAREKNVIVCLEPNPAEYGADFAFTIEQAARVVRLVNHPGFRLTLDTGCAFVGGDDIAQAIVAHADILYHIQIAERNLGSFESPEAHHRKAAEALAAIQYKNKVSIEMRPAGTEALIKAIGFVTSVYQRALHIPKTIAVIGGGWYGCHIAKCLIQDGHKVKLFERREGLFLEASSNNQFRLHLGFHYPRSFRTRDQMQPQFFRFRQEYPELIESVDWNFYAVASESSMVDFGTYLATMKSMGLSFQILDPSVYGIHNVEGMVACREMVFKRDAPAEYFSQALGSALELNCSISDSDIVKVAGKDALSIQGSEYEWLINCTYNHLHVSGMDSGPDCFYELCMLLVYEDLETDKPEFALTLMDGHLCSLYPIRSTKYSSTRRMMSLSSVAHTPLVKCGSVAELYAFEKAMDLEEILAERRPKFEAEISHFFPEFPQRYKYASHYMAYKTKPSGKADNRECFVSASGRMINIWSGKINSMYSAQERVGQIIGTPMKQYLGKRAALIGYTGFVGSSLNRAAEFHAFYNSKNIGEIQDESFDIVICAGAPAVKWKANKFPEQDDQAIDALIEHLRSIKSAKLFVLISTIDVYPVSIGHAEDFSCDSQDNHTYGKNRLRLEKFVQGHFPNFLVIRLPALFGPGLKKNYIFDLLNNNNVGSIDPNTKFQWYCVSDLMADITTILARNEQLSELLTTINLFPQPIHTADIINELFKEQIPFTKTRTHSLNNIYDLKTLHGEIFTSQYSGYIRGATEMMKKLRDYVDSCQERN